MIQLQKEGYIYISKAGIEYELLEGVSIGSSPQYTSDIIFIMLKNPFFYEVDTSFVNFFYGATFIDQSIEEYEKIIASMVLEYERRNNL